MNHQVKKQTISLKLNSTHEMYKVQQQTVEFIQKNLLPVLERELDKVCNKNDLLIISSLKFDLGRVKWANGKITCETNISDIVAQVLQNFSIANEKEVGRNSENRIGIKENNCLMWLLYINRGYLHWSIKEITSAIRCDVLEILATNFELVEKFREVLRHNKEAVKRIINENNTAFIFQLIEVLTAKKQHETQQVIKELQLLVKEVSSATGSKTVRQFKKEILLKRFLTNAANRIPEAETVKEIIRESVQPNRTISGFDETHQRFTVLKKIMLPELLTLIKKHKEEDADNSALKKITASNHKEVEMRNSGGDEMEEQGMFAANIGVLLLHPFLKQLFQNLNWLNSNNYFCNEQLRLKAVALLHYLCTGRSKFKDYEVVAAKLICGVEPAVYIPPYRISKKTKEEINNLTTAAIAQWKILGNTSVAGLRESFLQRNGKIEQRENGLYFLMEKKGIDILLDRLPWNLSLIKFSWLSKFIHVKWR